MSYRERGLWASLAAMLLVWGWYFAVFSADWRAGRVDQGDAVGDFALAVVLLVALHIVTATALAIRGGHAADTPADNRERSFAQAAARPAYAVLSCAVVAVMLCAPVLIRIAEERGGLPGPGVAPVIVGNALLAALVLAETVNTGFQLYRFRRGA